MITLTMIRYLELSAAPTAGRPLHLSAASGLACVHSYIYVVADDELQLGVFRSADNGPGHLIQLFEGALPEGKSKRKKQKPDLEGLTVLPPFSAYPHGALMALGSGSRPNRRMGALIGLDAQGAVDALPEAVDLSPILAPLNNVFHALNIEGAVVSGNELRLFQRGNKQHPENAIIGFPLSAVLDALTSKQAGVIEPVAVHLFDLGGMDGIPFGFTDAAALPDDDMVFTAVAEDNDDAYNDGPCVGAAIGIADNNGHVRCLYRLDRPYKVEGVDARMDGDVIRLLLVTDADDADIPAGLLSATIGE